MRKHRLLLVFLLAVTMCPVVYGQQQSACNIPSDKKEIIDRFIAGTLDPSYTPALFYGHFGKEQKLGDGALKAGLSTPNQLIQILLSLILHRIYP